MRRSKFKDKVPLFKEQLLNRFADLGFEINKISGYITKTLQLHSVNSELLISFSSESVVFVRPKFTARPCKKNKCWKGDI